MIPTPTAMLRAMIGPFICHQDTDTASDHVAAATTTRDQSCPLNVSRPPIVRALKSSGTAAPKSVNARRTASGPSRRTPACGFPPPRRATRSAHPATLEHRHHVTREQLVAAHRLLARRPFMRPEQDAAEAALAVLQQPRNPPCHRLRRADQRRAHLHAIAQRIIRPARRPSQRVLEVGDGFIPLALAHLEPAPVRRPRRYAR